jgi:hypothetical protein
MSSVTRHCTDEVYVIDFMRHSVNLSQASCSLRVYEAMWFEYFIDRACKMRRMQLYVILTEHGAARSDPTHLSLVLEDSQCYTC